MQHADQSQIARKGQQRQVICFMAFVLALFVFVPVAFAAGSMASAEKTSSSSTSSTASSLTSPVPAESLASSSSSSASTSSAAQASSSSSSSQTDETAEVTADAADDASDDFAAAPSSSSSFFDGDRRNARGHFFFPDGSGADSFEPADIIREVTVDPVAETPTAELARIADANIAPGSSAQLSVPIICQLDTDNGGRYLSAGCEVTSLAMILQANGVEVTKEDLADAVAKQPFIDDDGNYGNPNLGFVGEMEGWDEGYSVYHGPIVDLAKQYTEGKDLTVADLTGQDFSAVLQEVASGTPVWVIVDTSFGPSYNTDEWQTAEGTIIVNWTVHSVVVTGFDDDTIYVNDPYLYDADEAVDRDLFQQSWEQMGKQAVVVHANEQG